MLAGWGLVSLTRAREVKHTSPYSQYISQIFYRLSLHTGRLPATTYRAGSRRELWCERALCYHRRKLAGAIWGISDEVSLAVGFHALDNDDGSHFVGGWFGI